MRNIHTIRPGIIVFVVLCLNTIGLWSQLYVADKVVAVVGRNSILYSDIEDQYMQMKAQGVDIDKCAILEELLSQKLLVNQAQVDSIEITDGEVEQSLNQRIQYFIGQFGTEEKMIEYFGKTVLEMKIDMRDAIKEQLMMQRMQGEIVKGMSITPNEVKKYFKKLPKDSIPYVDSEIEINQIMLYPDEDEESVFEVKKKLLDLRDRVNKGENFKTLAVLYSEGPSATNGGDIGWTSKSDLDPAYSKAAVALKKGQVSKIVESSFGFHLIQLIDKADDRFRTRHILMKPKIAIEAKQSVKIRLDSIARVIRLDSLTFERAALQFSQDKKTRMNGGLRVNPLTLNSKFKIDEFEASEYYIIRKLQIGEISEPFESVDDKGKTVFKIIQLKSKSEPHRANLRQDFDMLKKMTQQDKQLQVVEKWVSEKSKDTYIRIELPYKDCNFSNQSWKK